MTLGLFLDTSSKNPLMVLIAETHVVDYYCLNSSKSSSGFIKEVNEFLERNNVTYKSLTYIGVGTGPGSFIGTRVGVILSKTFSYALKIPLLHFSSLMCYNVDKKGPFAILSDAKSKGLYALCGIKQETGIEFEKEPSLVNHEELIQFKNIKNLFSSDPEVVSQKNIHHFTIELATLDIHQIAMLCRKRYLEYVNNPSSLTSPEIFYLRLS